MFVFCLVSITDWPGGYKDLLVDVSFFEAVTRKLNLEIGYYPVRTQKLSVNFLLAVFPTECLIIDCGLCKMTFLRLYNKENTQFLESGGTMNISMYIKYHGLLIAFSFVEIGESKVGI